MIKALLSAQRYTVAALSFCNAMYLACCNSQNNRAPIRVVISDPAHVGLLRQWLSSPCVPILSVKLGASCRPFTGNTPANGLPATSRRLFRGPLRPEEWPSRYLLSGQLVTSGAA